MTRIITFNIFVNYNYDFSFRKSAAVHEECKPSGLVEGRPYPRPLPPPPPSPVGGGINDLMHWDDIDHDSVKYDVKRNILTFRPRAS